MQNLSGIDMKRKTERKGLALVAVIMVLCACSAMSETWKWASYGLPPSDLKTCIPDTRGEADSWWIPYVQNKLKQPKHDLLFLGDSITDLWTYPADHTYPGGLDTWNARFKAIATNYGVTGDKTQTVLWRLTEGGALDGYAPKQIVLLIGINNLLQGDTPADTAAGVKGVVDHLLLRLPEARVLVLGIFPCRASPADPIRAKIRETNDLIRKLADGRRVGFVDLGSTFLEPDGSITLAVMRDLLHLSPQGYAMWAESLAPHLQTLRGNADLPGGRDAADGATTGK